MRATGIWVVSMLAIALAACGSQGTTGGHDDAGHAHDEHGHGDHADESKGPNGGRLLESDDTTVEIRVVDEPNGSPRFHAWITQGGKAAGSTVETLSVTTQRLGGEAETFAMTADQNRYRSTSGIREPHSFSVKVDARIDGRNFTWSFDSFEGRVSIDAATAREAGISTNKISAGVIRQTIDAAGVVRPRESSTAEVIARFPGMVKAVRANVGDRVAAGSVLATIESNASLSTYSLTAPISGTVINRAAVVGAAVGDDPLFEIADTDSLQIDLRLFGKTAQRVRPGAKVRVERLIDEAVADSQISRVLPGLDAATQSIVVQTNIRNADGLWRPGSAVQAEVELSSVQVAQVVPAEALQTWREMDVVFIRVGDVYEVRPVRLGRRDRRYVEILEGLRDGDEVVVGQSYLIKADIEKSGATHDH